MIPKCVINEKLYFSVKLSVGLDAVMSARRATTSNITGYVEKYYSKLDLQGLSSGMKMSSMIGTVHRSTVNK